jgi:apolipoprotein N-acyltransferase
LLIALQDASSDFINLAEIDIFHYGYDSGHYNGLFEASITINLVIMQYIMILMVNFPPELDFISSILIYALIFLSVRRRIKEGKYLVDSSKASKNLILFFILFFGFGLGGSLLFYVLEDKHEIQLIQSILRWAIFLSAVVYFLYYLIRYGLRSPEEDGVAK